MASKPMENLLPLLKKLQEQNLQPEKLHYLCEYLRQNGWPQLKCTMELCLHVCLYGRPLRWLEAKQRLWNRLSKQKASQLKCPICGESLGTTMDFVMPCCYEGYHVDCINRSLEDNGTCPFCQEQFWSQVHLE